MNGGDGAIPNGIGPLNKLTVPSLTVTLFAVAAPLTSIIPTTVISFPATAAMTTLSPAPVMAIGNVFTCGLNPIDILSPNPTARADLHFTCIFLQPTTASSTEASPRMRTSNHQKQEKRGTQLRMPRRIT